MKLGSSDQKTINDFMRSYVDRSYKNPINCVRLNSEHTDAHRRMIFEVCNSLLKQAIPFYTEVRLKCGCIPDIVCPTHIRPFIEVLSSETIEMFRDLKLAKYPKEFTEKSFIFVDANKNFEEDLLW